MATYSALWLMNEPIRKALGAWCNIWVSNTQQSMKRGAGVWRGHKIPEG